MANAMPSPAIPRSTSDPFLSFSSSSKTRLTSSNRSTGSSSRSNRSSYWLAWSNINKLGNFISIGRKNPELSDSDLTEESLEAHNRRQEAIILQTHSVVAANTGASVDDKNAKCSPYYKGLTDYSLIINREKHHLPQSTSPERESQATTNVSNSSSLSSFVFIKKQAWTACFSSLVSSNKDKQNNAPASAPAPAPDTASAPPPPPPPPPPVPFPEPSVERMPLETKETDKSVLSVIQEEKPLRERVLSSESKSPPPSPTPPSSPPSIKTDAGTAKVDERNDTATAKVDERNDTAIEMLDGRKQFTWADKHRPKALKDFICNRATATRVQGMIRGVDCNHFIFEGPAGVGKRTMIWAMLQEAYGPDRVKIKEVSKAFNLKGESIGSIEVRIKVSSQHVEVNLSDLKGYEKHVIVELIKERSKGMSKKDLQSKYDNCRAIILYNADKLSADAVLYIKWLLERNKGSSMFFFCCSDVSKLQPIKELCTYVRLLLPSNEEIVEVLEFIAEREGIKLPRKFAESIAINSKYNLRQAIRSLEASWQRSYPFTEDQKYLTGWEDDIANIAKDMVEEQSPKQLYIIRGKLQNLIEHDVSPDFIFNTMVEELKCKLDIFRQQQLDNLYKDYSFRDKLPLEDENSSLFPSAEFIAKFMSLYKLHITTAKSMEHDSGS
ncbi:replication factor C subunit 3-like [Hevea brasiliensis]|uniref:replication factor C subunit 3-like n=1 Tax=Hevea brasiliensis TaxID=3981 RepID=UPI0025DCA770|nr:replication factor C subunit 3-like [Hevea brasiliensis]